MSRGTQERFPTLPSPYTYGAVTLFGGAFQHASVWVSGKVGPKARKRPTTPQRMLRFGLFPVRSPLLRESLLLSFPPPTKMCQFGGFASRICGMLLTRSGLSHSEIPGSKAIRRLPGAYRSLSRPSSPLGAKASTMCPCLLSPDAYLASSIQHFKDRRPTGCRLHIFNDGGEYRIRTDDLLVANQTL